MPRVVPEYKEQAKGRIVQAALEVFRKKGYYATTMDDVAERIGVSKGALYLYFKSKEDLYKSILNASFQDMTDSLRSAASSGGTPAQTCEAFFDNLTRDTASLGHSFEVISEASRNPALAKVVKDYYRDTTEVIEECMKELRKEGALGKEVDTHLLAQGLIAFFDGLMICLAVGFERPEVRKIFAELMKAIM